ncbi:Tumor necrosis factor alpha-inducing protein [Helicobacter sp. NHP19-012]|uniref:Tumor necrosis factor alpha-inducing protein n=1 Tax=Helicobacter gastrofelis TaxID=2849642 RepID=A0ABN6I663_9HELI|nr:MULTISPECIES: hypothetical protein [unclassified Helicobacter]BCZ19011.1 Tumor necrosis factor alpha-inducing protein [Helicobacter sp. NHP19-012]GMB96272.1 Tumor necrosis factor alpha-inducing protein [Helicobacter sp. NHP22-001]
MSRRIAFILASAFILGACSSGPKQAVFLQDMPSWMVQDMSGYTTQGIDSSHVIDGQVQRSEVIARDRARFRVAIHIADKLKATYTASQNAHQKPYDDAIFNQIIQAIAASLGHGVQLGEYVNPNNEEVFMLVQVNFYDQAKLQAALEKIKPLASETIQQIAAGMKKIFDELNLENATKNHHDFTKDRGGR